MKIAIGGMKKNEMENEVKKAAPEIDTIITTDIMAVQMLKNGSVDYYFGACESGGGAAIAILIGMLGYSKCCTVAKNGQTAKKEDIEKFIAEGKVAFGMAHNTIENTIPILIDALKQKT
ncbi:uncharacterized protein DUF2620 [Kineothrix alysoides]|uniref:Uncharacterized protein DUF2620 n=1 Tax=Kineothrix alysoides TaxID=1469948 RepID=A0A4R1R414_9FIRM|nr:DUF2620 family protein [Kineothrix alysoides]TCL60120.1 uncharacterized protein DUF2620 [Kineothrix alysoides]